MQRIKPEQSPLFSAKDLLAQRITNSNTDPDTWAQVQSGVSYLVMFTLEEAFGNQLFFEFDGNYLMTDATTKMGRPMPGGVT